MYSFISDMKELLLSGLKVSNKYMIEFSTALRDTTSLMVHRVFFLLLGISNKKILQSKCKF